MLLRGIIVLCLPVLAVSCFLQEFPAAATDSRSVEVESQGGPLQVTTANGAVEVRVDSTVSAVSVKASITARAESDILAQERAEQVELQCEHFEGGILRVEPLFPGERRSSEGCDLVVVLPAVLGVTVTTSNGNVDLQGTSGEASVKTSNGMVKISDHAGKIDVRTSNGKVVLKAVANEARVRTSNSKVIMEALADFAHDFKIKTSNSNVVVSLPGSPNVTISALTSNGKINGVGESGADEDDREIRLGDGEFVGRVKTSNGSINFETD